jgi:predicted enzyme related to lactoylglutathione lyase
MTNIDKHQPGTPAWFDLMTPDIEKARAFYKGVFGWDYDVRGPEAGNYSTAKVDGKKAAGMGSKPPGAPFPSAWTVYFGVENAETTAKTIKDNGGNVVMGPMDVFDEGVLVVATDPTGAVFGLWQPKNHKGAEVKDVHGAMGWQEVHTRDGNKTREFYGRVFKLEPVKLDDAGMEYWTLNRGKEQFGGVYHDTQMPEDVGPHWLAYFTVDNTDKAVSAVKSGGGKVIQDAIDTPYGRLAVVADPWSAVFAFIQPPNK